ncbi:MAG: hypothetical protein ABH885_07705 [Candidatus Omnitrophota bacterium]
MINGVYLGEEIVIVTKNKVGLLADIAEITARNGINIDAVLGYESGRSARILVITRANLPIMTYLREKQYKYMRETEVVMVSLTDKPGAMKVVTGILKKNKINIKYIYVTSGTGGSSSRMVLQTSDNEKTMSLLTRYVEKNK